jgi:hypothetical protein
MEEDNKTGEIRNEQGRFKPGFSGNPDGRPPETEEEKIAKKATKQFIEEYKEKLAESLPKISPVLIEKAIGGDIQAIKELNDRVMGKAPQSMEIGGSKDNPVQLLVKFIDGKETDNNGNTSGIQEAV